MVPQSRWIFLIVLPIALAISLVIVLTSGSSTPAPPALTTAQLVTCAQVAIYGWHPPHGGLPPNASPLARAALRRTDDPAVRRLVDAYSSHVVPAVRRFQTESRKLHGPALQRYRDQIKEAESLYRAACRHFYSADASIQGLGIPSGSTTGVANRIVLNSARPPSRTAHIQPARIPGDPAQKREAVVSAADHVAGSTVTEPH